MVITETWLKGTCPTLHQDYRQFQSPAGGSQGVLALIHKDLAATPYEPHRWSRQIIKLRIQLEPKSKPLLLIGVYIQPLERVAILAQLNSEVTRDLASSKFSTIVIAGDLNSTQHSLNELLPAAAIFQFRTVSEGTRISAQGKWSSLDYIASTAPISVATRYGHLSKSDHFPIGVKILAEIITKS